MCTKSSSPSTPGQSPTPQFPSTSKSPLLKAVVEKICDLNYFDGRDIFDKGIIASRYKFSHLFCGECGRKCSSRAGKVSHERTHYSQKARTRRKKESLKLSGTENKPRVYTCKACFEKFSERKSLIEHKKESHSQTIHCACCNESFKDRSDYEWQHAINDGVTQASSKSRGYQTRSQSRPKIAPNPNGRLNGTVSSMSFKRVISSSLSIVSPLADAKSSSLGYRTRSHSRSSSQKTLSGRSRSVCTTTSLTTSWRNFAKITTNPNGRLNGTVSSLSSKRVVSSSFSIVSPIQSMNIKMSDEDDSNYGSENSDNESDVDDLSLDHRSTASSRLSIISHLPAVDDGSVSPPTLSQAGIYACKMEDCSYEPFDNLLDLSVHESVSHNKLLLFACPECRRRFSSRENLQIHIFLDHTKSLTTRCPLCDLEIRGIMQVTQHANLHRNKRNLSCRVCHRKFLSFVRLKEHLNNAAKYHANYKDTKVVVLHYNYYGVNKVDCTYDFLSIVSKQPVSNLSYTELFFINAEHDQDHIMRKFCVHLPWRAR